MAEIFLDQLKMAHTINFQNRLELDSPTISLVDLLLSKLQIIQITEKDIKDLVVLLVEHDLGAGDRDKIDVEYLTRLTKDDWGLYYTASINLEKVRTFTRNYEIIGANNQQKVVKCLDTLFRRIEETPKTLRWKTRAKIGTRLKWFEEVGDVHR